MIGGDFNLACFMSDTSNNRVNYKWCDMFNDWIDRWGLLELSVTTRAYTWTNKQDNPVMAKIDRVFISTDWDMHYPLSRIRANPREGNDHTPLVINTSNNIFFGKKRFWFEKWWLERDDFREVVVKAWSTEFRGCSNMDRWQGKVRIMRKAIRGWLQM